MKENKLVNQLKCNNIIYHLLALMVVSIWGVTFVSTKILLMSGLTPSDILFYRLILAYIGICLCSRPLRILANSIKDESLFFTAGLLGGTLYFMTENTALKYTLVSNVALICSTTPLLTMLIQYFIIERTKPDKRILIASLVAFIGVSIVIFNGKFIFNLNPIGDLLCLTSAFSWTLYTLVTKSLSKKYSSLFIVRKTFFYGIITLIPILIHNPLTTSLDILSADKVWSRLLFLGIIASFICFMLWNICLRKLNTISLSNYIYLVPIISIATSNLILGENINFIIIIGAIFVVLGMYFTEKRQ